MLPDNFQLWPANDTAPLVVTIGIPPGDLEVNLKQVQVAARFTHEWMVPEERDVPICVAMDQ